MPKPPLLSDAAYAATGMPPVAQHRRSSNRRPIAVPVRFVEEGLVPHCGSLDPSKPEALEDLFEELAKDDQRSLARELRADAQADLMGFSGVDSKKLLADVRRAKADAAETLRLTAPCEKLLLALGRHEVPEPLLNAIGREVAVQVKFAIKEESERLYGGLRQRVAEEVAAASQQRTEALSLALCSGLSKVEPSEPSHAAEGNNTSRQMCFLEKEACQHAALFGQELRANAEEAKAELDSKIGLMLQNLREALHACKAEPGDSLWKEVPQMSSPCGPPADIRKSSGATPVQMVSSAALCEATPPPDEELPRCPPVDVDVAAAAISRGDSSDLEISGPVPMTPKPAEDPDGLLGDMTEAADAWSQVVETPRDPALRLEESEQRLQLFLQRLAEAAELEHRARQESELWLLGRVGEVKREVNDVLLRLVCFLETEKG